VGSIFSGLGSTLLKELIAKARRRDTEQLQQLLRQAPKEYSQSHRADPNIVINVPILTSLANQTYLLPLAKI
jgi:cellobiose-specific phosphotransferase system component IIA